MDIFCCSTVLDTDSHTDTAGHIVERREGRERGGVVREGRGVRETYREGRGGEGRGRRGGGEAREGEREGRGGRVREGLPIVRWWL